MTTPLAQDRYTAEEMEELGQQLRVDSVRASAAANSGHPTSSMSAADLIAVLLMGHLRFDVSDPDADGNDHLIFSKRHASPLLYAALKAAGEEATRVAFGEALAALGGARPEVVVLDGEVSDSTRTDAFAIAHPERFFECFIAEQQMVAAAAGMQVRGWVPARPPDRRAARRCRGGQPRPGTGGGAARRPRAAARVARCPWTPLNGGAGPASHGAG